MSTELQMSDVVQTKLVNATSRVVPMHLQIRTLKMLVKAKKKIIGPRRPPVHFVEAPVPDVNTLALEDIDEVLYFFAEVVLAEGTWMEYEDEVFELYASLNFVLRRVLMNQGGFECVAKIQGNANGLIDRDVILHSGLIMLSDHDI